MVRTLRKEGLNQRTFGQNGALNYYWTKLFLQSNSNNLLSISIFPCWNLHHGNKKANIFSITLYLWAVMYFVLALILTAIPAWIHHSSQLSHEKAALFFSTLFLKQAEFFVHLSFQSQSSSSQSSTKVVVLNRMECCVGQRQQQNWIPTSLANSWFLDESTKDFAANMLVTPSGVWWLPP